MMIGSVITSKIFSTLGNNSSLIPLGIKDVSNTLGMTAGSYVTGSKVEGKDRFIDEFGTQIIWLMGIPFFKYIIDKTVYKLAKFNPKIDTRILKNKEIFEKAKKHAPQELKAGFERIATHQKFFKGLAYSKFGVSTALTLASYSVLTTFRHKHTEKAIIDEFKKEEQTKKANQEFVESKSKVTFSGFGKNQQKLKKSAPSFGMNASVLEQFMFDPVKNTMIIDGGISTERFAESRNPQDFIGYVIKEGGFWAFMYFLGPIVQKHLEKKAAQKHTPIDLDIRVLQDKYFKPAISSGSIKDDLSKFSTTGTEAEIYESLFDKSENMVVKMAKKAGIIKTIKDSDAIDTQHYIDIGEIKDFKTKIQTIFDEATSSEKGIEKFFDKVINLKKVSIAKNIMYPIAALGILVPGIMVAMRFMNKDNKEFRVKTELHEKLKQDSNFMGQI